MKIDKPVVIDLSQAEIDRIIAVTEYIANHETGCTVAKIKRKFGLTDEEYDICMELAMPTIRALGTFREWKNKYLKLLRDLMRATIPPSQLPPEHRRKMDWSEDPVLRLGNLTRKIERAYYSHYKPGSMPVDGMDEEELDDADC
jgi:hypothetical protein